MQTNEMRPLSWPSRRATYFLVATAIALLPGLAARAETVNPTPSPDKLCGDGRPRLVFDYGTNSPIPDNATRVDCGEGRTCYAVPQGFCLQMVEVRQVQRSSDLPPMDARKSPPPSGSTLLPRSDSPPTPTANPPSYPYGNLDPIEAPERECVAGKGWDFETTKSETNNIGDLPLKATFEGWKPDSVSGSPFAGIQNVDQDMPGAPVYGNAAPIDRIRPPGWSPQIAQSIGGDYWLYSQSVNQHGHFWLSSRYRRYSWGQQPGSMWDERAAGMLESPECRLNANYLTFRMSGGRSSSQRIEVQVQGASTRDYFGIKFPRVLGDNSDFFRGTLGHASQVVSIPSPAQYFPPSTSGWTTVRTVTSEDIYETDWMQLYAFNLSQFRGSRIRIRVIDDARHECALISSGQCREWRPEHINADQFLFTDSAPEGVRWMAESEGETGYCANSERCQQVGVVDSKPPLWGFTDAHAHPMANLAFGGHVMWGDVTDELADVYDCSRALPAIPGPGGRAAIPEPASTSRCYIAGDFDFILTGIARTVGCAPLSFIPFVGIGIANICQSVIASASVALLTTPVVTGLRLHGAKQMSSGAVLLGPMFTEAWLNLVQWSPLVGFFSPDGLVNPTHFAEGLMVEIDSWEGVQSPLSWYPNTKSAHSYLGLGKLHTAYQADMIRRAYDGGMRLGVWDVVNSRGLALIAEGNAHASDWQALKDQTDAAKRILSTSLSGIAAMALTPDEADAIIRSGRMAVILGSEVDELGRPRPDGLPWPRSPRTPGDSMEKQVADLWELGIRKVTPVHAVNNPIGGPAIFTERYVANNHYINGTPLDGKPSTLELPAVRFFLDRTFIPLATITKMLLGEFPLLAKVGDDGKESWNPEGWFEIAGEPSQLDGIIDGYSQITYRIGQGRPTDSTGGPTSMKDDNGNWLPPSEILGKQVLVMHSITDMSTVIRPSGGCDLYNTVMPNYATSFGPTVDEQYTAINGHRNKLGLYKTDDGQDGTKFLREMMQRGMLIDVDHMSQRMRLDVYALTAKFAQEAGRPACALNAKSCQDYPVIGVHSTIRGFEKEGSDLPHLVMQFGSNDESTRTAKEMAYVAARGGTLGVFPRPTFIPPVSNTLQRQEWDIAIPHEVKNDCDGSTKTFALKYLAMMSAMKGRGLTMTTDFNGLAGTAFPRFGRSIAGKMACNQGGRGKTLPGNWLDLMTGSQEIEASGVWYQDYASRAPTESSWSRGWIDPVRQPPNRRWKQVVARAVGEVREDRAPRFSKFSDGTPINDRVYYNDFGADNAFRNWRDQSGNRPGAQMFPMVRWDRLFHGWDYNLDGFQHIGLAPDLLQDMRNVGVQWEQMEPLMHGANDFVATWRRSVEIGRDHR